MSSIEIKSFQLTYIFEFFICDEFVVLVKMDVPENNSVLSINNSFYKLFKTINEKKGKNESTAKEIETIQAQLLSENTKICSNAVNVLISSSDFGFALNCLVSTLPRVKAGSYEIVAEGIIQLLLQDAEKPNYKCLFDITKKPHPMLQLIDESSDKMLFLSQKIIGIVENSDL